MADTPDTPKTDADKPATRRRAPRATTTRKTPTARKAPAAKDAAAKVESVAKPAKAVKPRSTKRATPRPSSRTAAAKSSVAKATDKVGGKWGLAAIAGGVAATGAALAALVSLRGSTPKDTPAKKGKRAHQPDGTDSSKSFNAGIADENTIPE